jgi:hypothetical protein
MSTGTTVSSRSGAFPTMGHRRDNAGLRAGDTTVCSLTLALQHEPICPEDKEKLNRGTKEQIDWSAECPPNGMRWRAAYTFAGNITMRNPMIVSPRSGDFGQGE